MSRAFISLCALLGLAAPAVAQASTSVFNLFVIDPPESTRAAPLPTIMASVIGHGPGPSDVTYLVECPKEAGGRDEMGGLTRAPCNRIHGATVTVRPAEMVLDVGRTGDFTITRGIGEDGQLETGLSTRVVLNVTGTASCSIGDTSTATCGYAMSTLPSLYTLSAGETVGVGVSNSQEDLSTQVAGTSDFASHTVNVTITAGLDKLPPPAASTTTGAGTSSSTGAAAPRVTQQAVVLAGVAVVIGGVAMV